MEDKTQGQRRLDGEVEVAQLPSTTSLPHRLPVPNRLVADPQSQASARGQGAVVVGPVADLVLRLVLAVNAGLFRRLMAPTISHRRLGRSQTDSCTNTLGLRSR